MRLATRLSIGRGGKFRRSMLPLEGFWRPNFTVPWVGSASAGGSAGRNADEATNPPSVAAAALNGLDIADFDGVNDELSTTTLGTFYTGTAYSGWALVDVDAIATDSAFVYENDCILSTIPSAYWVLFLRSSGVVGIRHFGASEIILTATFATGGLALVQWSYDGTTLSLRVNSDPWQTIAADTLAADFSNVLAIGRNYSSGHHLNGKLAEAALSKAAFGAAVFDKVKTDINSDYALAL